MAGCQQVVMRRLALLSPTGIQHISGQQTKVRRVDVSDCRPRGPPCCLANCNSQLWNTGLSARVHPGLTKSDTSLTWVLKSQSASCIKKYDRARQWPLTIVNKNNVHIACLHGVDASTLPLLTSTYPLHFLSFSQCLDNEVGSRFLLLCVCGTQGPGQMAPKVYRLTRLQNSRYVTVFALVHWEKLFKRTVLSVFDKANSSFMIYRDYCVTRCCCLLSLSLEIGIILTPL